MLVPARIPFLSLPQKEDCVMIKRSQLSKILHLINFFFLTILVHSQNKPNEIINASFPGCEKIVDIYERENCAQLAFMEYIYDYFTRQVYFDTTNNPVRMVIEFSVLVNGKIDEVKIIQSNNLSLEGGLIEHFKCMNEFENKWTPYIYNGIPKKMKYTFPVRLRLEQ